MYFFRYICLSFIIILLAISLYNDLKKESISIVEDEINETVPYRVAKVKLERGDTILTISERLNEDQLSQLSIEQILSDFQQVNPKVDLHSLEVGNYYYFPIYEKN